MRRIRERLDFQPGGCWLWTGCLTGAGYGTIRWAGSQHLTHRVVYEKLVGEIRAPLQLDHICRVRPCANPKHLRLVTVRENVLAYGSLSRTKANLDRVTCPAGHPYSGANLYRRPGGGRGCRPCRLLAAQRYREVRRGR